MSETITSLATENLNPSLRSLLEDVQRGHIRVPRFQRPFVWSDTQRLELLRSIREGMPIGSLLLWRTTAVKLATFDVTGPHVIPPAATNAPLTGWQYLLDGHQRVTTLLSLLLAPSQNSSQPRLADDDDIDWDIQYDLMSADFVFGARSKNVGRPRLPLSTLLDGRLVSRYMRELRNDAKKHGWSDQDLELWEERADQLSYVFVNCRVPIVVMVTDDLALAVKTFQRVNSLGTPMDESNFVAALTWTPEFDLRQRLEALQMQFPVGWQDVDDQLLLTVCKGLVDLDVTKAGQSALAEKINNDSTLLDRAGTALLRAVEWLVREAVVMRRELLPYTFQVVLLAVEFDKHPELELPHKAILAWFWSTCWSEIFGAARLREVQDERARLQAAVDGKPSFLWRREREFPDLFDFRSARVRLVTLRLATRQGLMDANGNPANGRELLERYGRAALVRLFAAPVRASATLKKLIQGAGNRFLLDPHQTSAFRELLKTSVEISPSGLEAHFIDIGTLEALRDGDLETFLRRRLEAMNDWDRMQYESESNAAIEM